MLLCVALVVAAADPAFFVYDVGASDVVSVDAGAVALGAYAADGSVVFATNGGIFETPSTPTGLLIAKGKEHHPLNLNSGEGNFFLQPNGVLFRTEDGKWHILESQAY